MLKLKLAEFSGMEITIVANSEIIIANFSNIIVPVFFKHVYYNTVQLNIAECECSGMQNTLW